MSTSAASRPVGVSVVAVIAFIQGIVGILVGIGLVVERDNDSLVEHIGRSSDTIATYGWIAIGWGVLTLLVARGLWRGAGFARGLVGILEVLQVAGGVYLLFGWDGHYRWQGIEQIAIALVVLVLLFNRRADAFFADR